MPGRTPAEAFDAFIEPLQLAISCLGHGNIVPSRKGKSALGVDHAVTINEAEGLDIGQGRLLDSRIVYQIIRDERGTAQPFRITTRMYMHSLRNDDGAEIIGAHWHPSGASPYHDPHWHMGSAALAESGVFSPRAHIPAPRTSLEQVVHLAITQLGIPPRRDDWAAVLNRCDTNFRQHRSWG